MILRRYDFYFLKVNRVYYNYITLFQKIVYRQYVKEIALVYVST